MIDSTKEQARATLLFHLVWFMAGRSDIRPQLVELISQLLNEDIIPILPRSPTYVFRLMQFLSNGDEAIGSVKTFGDKTFASANLQPLGELTGFETFAFTRDQVAKFYNILHHVSMKVSMLAVHIVVVLNPLKT